jgi:nitrite reductase (NADH) large subunit
MTDYLIIGNGVAANSAAETIHRLDPEGSIRMLTKEEYPFYYTPALPEYLSDEKALQNILIHDLSWYEKNGISFHRRTEAVEIDLPGKTVVTDKGLRYQFDRLLLATGALCRVPPIAGVDSDGVFTLRTVADADAIIARIRKAKKLVLIGGGLLGLEAGNGLRKRGLQVSVVEFFPRLLPRQTDATGAAILQKQMEAMGFSFHLGASTREIVRSGSALSVELETGERLEADMVLVSAGIRPETALARSIGAEIGKGVKVDDTMKTSIRDVYAAGDLIEHRETLYGIWPAAMEQGRVAGANMAGEKRTYEGTVPANKLKVAGVLLFAAGDIDADGKRTSIMRKDEASYLYRKLVLKNNALIGAILLGDLRGSDEIQHAIRTGMDISAFGEDMADGNFDFAKIKRTP